MNKTSSFVVILAAALLPRPSFAADAKTVGFIKDVQPILKESCVKCHSLNPKNPKRKGAGELRLDDKAAALKGGRSGQAIVPGDSKNSLLVKLLAGPVPRPVKGEDDKDIDAMPKAKKGEKWKPLTKDQIAIIAKWIDQGADWPNAPAPQK